LSVQRNTAAAWRAGNFLPNDKASGSDSELKRERPTMTVVDGCPG
jgi:hypothetical protein